VRPRSHCTCHGLIDKPGEGRQAPSIRLHPVFVVREVIEQEALGDAGSHGDLLLALVNLDGEVGGDEGIAPRGGVDGSVDAAGRIGGEGEVSEQCRI
jgi:hypothetical protein